MAEHHDDHQSDGKARAIFTTLRLPAFILLGLAIMLIVGFVVSR